LQVSDRFPTNALGSFGCDSNSLDYPYRVKVAKVFAAKAIWLAIEHESFAVWAEFSYTGTFLPPAVSIKVRPRRDA
jgi:hypothetical protein